MEPADILSQIKPCDMENPYIFISYSAQDHARVWADVLAFQQLGFNVWLDERNLDKTKDSWTEDALSAISDLDCLLVLFYVSSSSLTSEACYRELSQTTEALTKCIHFGPVRFIAVDVENVGDIGAFTQEVYTNLMRRKDISKKEKTAKAIVLSQFCENFFGSNNERVRVHPKDEPNRKIDYYEEIVASFPDAAKIYPPVKTLAELAPKKKATPAPEPEAAPEPAPKVTPGPETSPKPEPAAAPDTTSAPAPAPKAAATPEPTPADTQSPAGALAEQLSQAPGRWMEPMLTQELTPTDAMPETSAAATSPSEQPKAETSAAKASSPSLVDQVSALLSSQAAAKDGDEPADAETGDDGQPKPSLKELIQRKLEEQKKDDKKK